MSITRWRTIVLAFLASGLTSAVSTAHAGSLGRVGDPFDGEALRALAALAHHVEVRVAVATDIDEDGDLDVVASTVTGLVVWVNDGSGHFETQTPRQGPTTRGEVPPTSWSGGDVRCAESIQTDGVSAPFITAEAPAAGDIAASGPRSQLGVAWNGLRLLRPPGSPRVHPLIVSPSSF